MGTYIYIHSKAFPEYHPRNAVSMFSVRYVVWLGDTNPIPVCVAAVLSPLWRVRSRKFIWLCQAESRKSEKAEDVEGLHFRSSSQRMW